MATQIDPIELPKDPETTAATTAANKQGLGGTSSALVDEEAARIMSQDSALMQKAKTDGLRTANSRGLLNSSMAAQASQAAVLDQVVPMASQNAGQNFDTQRSTQDFEEEQSLATQQGEIQTGLLQTESDLKRAENEEQRTFEAEQANLDRNLQSYLAEMDIDAADRRGVENTLINAYNDYEQSIASVNSNPDLSSYERQSQIDAAQNLLAQKIDYTQQLYSNAYEWPENVFMEEATYEDPVSTDNSTVEEPKSLSDRIFDNINYGSDR